MTTDWGDFQNRDLSPQVWQFIKDKNSLRLFQKSMEVLDLLLLLILKVIEKFVSRSQVLAITIMVPNSLGPAELILKHGTTSQKKNI